MLWDMLLANRWMFVVLPLILVLAFATNRMVPKRRRGA